MKFAASTIAAALLLAGAPGHAQPFNDPVVASADAEALFTSKDTRLNRNKQTALRIVKELLEAGHWERAPLYLTERYIQHNPFAASGLDAVVHYFVDVAKVQPEPIPAKMKTKVVAVQAEGDYVTVSYVRELPDPKDPARTYTTTWFDMWRFVDGKADEHWDPAALPAPPPPAASSPDTALLEAQDRAAIARLEWDYGTALDAFDADAYVQVFTPDGAFGATKGRDALRKMLTDLKASQDARRAKGEVTGAMRHVITNQTIEFVDRDHARFHYYWMTVFATNSLAQPPRLAAAGKGLDEVVRIDGKWLIANRNVTAD